MQGFRIGRLFGIDIRVDWSWVFIFVLMTWNLAVIFARWHPDWAPAGHLMVAVAASLLFFASVLLHELAHSLVATHHGVRVRSITLFLFGGVSNIEREPPTPRAEFLTAIVGPLTSIALGVGFIALASLMLAPSAVADADTAQAAMEELGPVPTMLVWLGPINVTIGLFNLLPGFPLDGGRVLRSILWKVSGDFRRATRAASAAGQVIGWLFVLLGLAMTFGLSVPYFGTGLGSGLWLAFIGWFLSSAAAQTTRRLAIDEMLTGHTVGELMRGRELSVSPEMSVASLVHDHFIRYGVQTWPVVRGDQLLGLASIADVRGVPPEQWARTSVAAIMKKPESLVVATPEEPLTQAFADFATKGISQLPVVANGSFLGVLERSDIARWLELGWHPLGWHPGEARP